MIRTPRRCWVSCWGRIPRSGDLAAVIAGGPPGIRFSPRRWCASWCSAGCWPVSAVGYVCRADVADVAVPATVQAAIEARIDRLSAAAKRTLNAASVIGARFGAELLAALGIDAVLDEVLSAELIDQVRFTPHAEYAFRHPLIRAVAYESQLKSGSRRAAPARRGRHRIR